MAKFLCVLPTSEDGQRSSMPPYMVPKKTIDGNPKQPIRTELNTKVAADKSDKTVKKKAMDINKDVFGDNDNYDQYDDIGGAYEDDFF